MATNLTKVRAHKRNVSFPVLALSREDIASRFGAKIAKQIPDEEMELIAGKLGDGLLDEAYWNYLQEATETVTGKKPPKNVDYDYSEKL